MFVVCGHWHGVRRKRVVQLHIHDAATGERLDSKEPWPVRGALRAQRAANRLYRDNPSSATYRSKVTVDGVRVSNTGNLTPAAERRAVREWRRKARAVSP